MSTFRPATRRIHPRRYRARPDRPLPIRPREDRSGMEPRRVVAAAILCAAIFAGSFAVGREGRTAASHGEAAPLAAPLASVGSAIPARLSSAPAIQIEAAATPAPNTLAAGLGTRHAPLPEARAIVAPVPPTESPPPAAVSPRPAAEAPAASAPQPSAPSAAPPASSNGSPAASPTGAAPASETKSFDTSG
jgi:hypothetical protein